MKVSELIEHLKTVDPEFKVVIAVNNSDKYFVLDEPETVYESEIVRLWIEEKIT